MRVLVTSSPSDTAAGEGIGGGEEEEEEEAVDKSPILLVRSCVELGCDHYDLVV
jgi:hypothetical protein